MAEPQLSLDIGPPQLAFELWAISLHQPWASFIPAGLKPFETRSWAPPARHIGQRIAIQAAKKRIADGDRHWAATLGITALPVGAVVCTAILAGAYRLGDRFSQTARITNIMPGSRGIGSRLHVDEFGDYGYGRWAWLLSDIEDVEPAIPTRGFQGFWRLPHGLIDA